MNGVKSKTTVEVNLSADEWDLYTMSKDCTEAAEAMNKIVEEALNNSATAMEAYRKISPVFSKYADYGAYDTEPMYQLNCIIRRVFPDWN